LQPTDDNIGEKSYWKKKNSYDRERQEKQLARPRKRKSGESVGIVKPTETKFNPPIFIRAG